MNPLTRKLSALGAGVIIAVSGGVLVGPWENRENHAYKDMVGIASICYGETKGVKMGDYRTNDQCDESLAKELDSYNKAMNKYVKVPLKPYEEVAYTSLVWNIGETAFKGSKSVLERLNSGDHEGACRGILDWNKATFSVKGAQTQMKAGETCTLKDAKKGEYLCTVKGLTNRRLDEYKTCTGNNSKVNEALYELSVSQNALETSKPVDTSIHLPEINESLVEPSDAVPEPLEEQHIVPEQQEDVSEVKCSFKLFGFCFQKR